LDGSITTLAPNLDILSEVMNLWATISDRHGEHLAAMVGIEHGSVAPDAQAIRAAFGVVDDSTPLTHDELRRRRELIRGRMAKPRR
jgi:hypothetical protein